jgi:transforming growth factor-beta-induced protein
MKNLIQMNYLKKFTLAMLFLAIPFITVSCNDDDDDMGGTDEKNIVQIAQDTPELSTLVDALVAANLTGALSGDGPFTVFAPTNAAFQKLDPTTLNTIISTPSLLTALLQYHVVADEVFSNELSNGNVPTLLSGQSVAVNVSGGMVTLNGSSKVTTADVDASNGVIHIIDEVLLPEDFVAQTIVQIAAGNPDFSILVAALSKPELADLLAAANDPTQDLTVFAPNNAAFEGVLAALGKESIDDIPVELLKEIVSYHIVGGAVLSTELSNGDVATILPGLPGGPDFETVAVDITDGVTLNGSSNVVAADITAVNGVIHAVDAVLLPSYVALAVGTVSEVVLFEKDFTILAAALRKAELLNVVSTTDNITVFAPDNAGFVAAGITNLDDYTAEELTAVLTYHVIGAKVLSSQLPADGIATMLNEENIYLGYLFNSGVLINGVSNITAVDIEKSNGVIHVIDRTLLPPAPNVVEIAALLADAGEASEFTVLVSLLTDPAYSDIADAIIAEPNITVFAPTDAAFAAIADIIGTLTEEQIRTVLTYHAAGARVFAEDLNVGDNLTMLNLQDVRVKSISDTEIVLEDKSDDDAIVIIKNVHGSNGVIHAINKVLIPNL